MSGAQIGDLIAAVIAVLGAATAYLKAHTATKSAAAAHKRIDALPAVAAPVTAPAGDAKP